MKYVLNEIHKRVNHKTVRRKKNQNRIKTEKQLIEVTKLELLDIEIF